MRNYLVICILMMMMLSTSTVRADYPIGKGRTAIIGTYNYYYSNKYFNDAGKIVNYAAGDNFQSHGMSINFAHGIGRNVDIILSVPFAIQNFTGSGIKSNNAGLTDINMGLSFHFPSVNYQKYFTIKVNGIIPAYSNQDSTKPFLGYASKGASIALNYSFSPFNDGFAIVEAAYTRFFDNVDGPNQYRINASLSKMLNQNTSLNFSFAHQISQSDNISFNPNFSVNKNFSGGTLSVGLSKRITRTITPAVSAFYTLYGKNLGLGVGANFTLIVRMP